jgi:hypothetical protein
MVRTRLKRPTTPIIRRFFNTFVINARMECTNEEQSLMSKYFLQDVVLTPGNVRRDVWRSAGFALVATILLYFLLIHRINVLPVLIFFVLWFLIYHQIREEVRVNDLLVGRNFKASSLVELLVREQRIRKMSGVFAIVMEQARTWHEPEVIPVEPKPLGITLAPTPEGSYEVT